MRPGVFNLVLYRGDTYRWQFVLWTDDAKTDPADLSDVTVEAEIRNTFAGLSVLPMACVVTEPNIIDMTLEATDWTGWAHDKAVWDLQLTYGDGSVFTALKGTVTVAPDVTDSSSIALLAMQQGQQSVSQPAARVIHAPRTVVR